MTAKHRIYYTRDRNAILARKRNNKNKWELVQLFGNQCVDCKQIYPMCAYDFHHLDPSAKEGRQALTTKRKDRIVKEIEKCVLLCANCHRIRHWNPPERSIQVEPIKQEVEAKL